MPEFEYPDSYRNLNSIKSNSWEGPYTSVANANASIPLGVREQGVLITVIEAGEPKLYWYKGGVDDVNLVPVTQDSIIPHNYIFVAPTGSDTSYKINDRSKPFATIKQACILASAENIAGRYTKVQVMPGVYNEVDVLSNFSYLYFEKGAIVVSSSTLEVALFSDTSGAKNFSVEGYGRFYRYNHGNNKDRETLALSNANSHCIKFECLEVDSIQFYGSYTKSLTISNCSMVYAPTIKTNANVVFNNVVFKSGMELSPAGSHLGRLECNECTFELPVASPYVSYQVLADDGVTVLGTMVDTYQAITVDTSAYTQQIAVDTINLGLQSAGQACAIGFLINSATQIQLKARFNNCRIDIYKSFCVGVKVVQTFNSTTNAGSLLFDNLHIRDLSAGKTTVCYSFQKASAVTVDYPVLINNSYVKLEGTTLKTLATTTARVELITGFSELSNIDIVTSGLAKKENITLDVTGSFSGGLTGTVVTGQSLTSQPRFLEIDFANVNTGVGVPTLNVDGTGALQIWDSITDAPHAQNSIANGKKFFIKRFSGRYYTYQLQATTSKAYVDAQDKMVLKSLFCVANTSDGGATFTATIPNYVGTSNPLLIHVYFGASSYPNMSESTTINFGFGATPIYRGGGRFLEPNMLIATTITMSSTDGTYYYIPRDIGRLRSRDYYARQHLSITSAISGTVINGGSIVNTTMYGFACVPQFRSGTSANSGYKLNNTTSKTLEPNFSRDYLIVLPGSAAPTRMVRIGLGNDVNMPSSVTEGVYFEINGLVITGVCKSTTTSTTATSLTLSNGGGYRLVIQGNADNSVISFYVYELDTEVLLWKETITTALSIPSAYGSLNEILQAISNELVSNKVLIGIVNYGIGTIEGYNKLG